MSDFSFLKNPLTGNWIISAPRRSQRAHGVKRRTCPFCPKYEENVEVYRVPQEGNWQVLVIQNKFPFTLHHEVIIHSPNHYANFEKLSQEHTELVFQTYRQRFTTHKEQGQVYIFQNHGHAAGESIGHPHSQLVVVPFDVELKIPTLESAGDSEDKLETDHFAVFCPPTSVWPDEVWIAPKKEHTVFGEINDEELSDFSFTVSRLIQIFDIRHGNKFPFNYYIYPGKNWYLRLIPRIKILGGFEVGTGVMVNTQKPKETFAFIKEHFREPDHEKIRKNRADYERKV